MDDPPELEEILRGHIRQHNWQALGFTLFSFAGAAFLWVALYAVLYWLTLLFLVVAFDPDASVPRGFPLAFAGIAGALLGAAWMDFAATTNERPPDKRPAFEIFMDFLLAIPRATLAVWGNFSAVQWLGRADYRQAAELVHGVARDRQLAVQSTPLYITDAEARERIVYALLVARVLEVRLSEGDSWLRLSPFRPEKLRYLDQASLQR